METFLALHKIPLLKRHHAPAVSHKSFFLFMSVVLTFYPTNFYMPSLYFITVIKYKYNPSNFKSTFTEGKQYDKLIPSQLLMNAEKWKY